MDNTPETRTWIFAVTDSTKPGTSVRQFSGTAEEARKALYHIAKNRRDFWMEDYWAGLEGADDIEDRKDGTGFSLHVTYRDYYIDYSVTQADRLPEISRDVLLTRRERDPVLSSSRFAALKEAVLAAGGPAIEEFVRYGFKDFHYIHKEGKDEVEHTCYGTAMETAVQYMEKEELEGFYEKYNIPEEQEKQEEDAGRQGGNAMDYKERMERLERIQNARNTKEEQELSAAQQNAYDAYKGLMRGTTLAEEVREMAELWKKAEDAGLDPAHMVSGGTSITENRNGIQGFRLRADANCGPAFLYADGDCVFQNVARNVTYGTASFYETVSISAETHRDDTAGQFLDFCRECGICTADDMNTLARVLSSASGKWQEERDCFYECLDRAISGEEQELDGTPEDMEEDGEEPER